MKKKRKVLVIGWDAADWKVIDPLIAQGKMPALKSLMDRGVYGKIQTLDPPLSPMLWTSIATGFRADTHGIGGFVEPNPDGTGLRPVTSTSRKVNAIWNILHNQGYKSNVVAWWPSNPVEPINGVMVSNLYQVANDTIDKEWIMPKGTVYPKSLTEEMKQWRVHPGEITLSMAIPFVPNLATDKELRKEKRVAGILKVIGNAASVHAASTHLMATTDWDFTAVYHDAIDHFSHLAMKYHPPRRPHIDEKEFENFQHVVEAGYRFQDMMLERCLDLADDETTVIIVSDHGFHSDHQRPMHIPQEPSGPAVEHSPYGILIMAGPGIRTGGQRISGASILDITPTLLALYGLPVGKDMEGKVLHAALAEGTQVHEIDSWENIEGDFGRHDPDLQEDPWEAAEALQQLVDLGYIDEIGDDKLLAVEKAKRENRYYIARNLINAGKLKPAIAILETIFDESKVLRYGQRLAFALLSSNQLVKCQRLINELRALERQNATERRQAHSANKTEGKDLFENKEFEEPMYLELVEGLLHLKVNRTHLALPLLEKVQQKNPGNFQVALNIGKIFNLRKNYVAAEKQFIKALAIDDRNAHAHHGLGLSFLRRGNFELAVDEFMAALNENFFLPTVHYHLGEAFVKTGYYSQAVDAFTVAVRLSPGMTKAHKWLVELYTKQLNQPEKAKEHVAFLHGNIRGNKMIVTGLQGSGYQFVLDEIKRLGGELYEAADETLIKRFLDPRVLKLHQSSDWLSQEPDTILYVPPQFLAYLPHNVNYKCIVVEADDAVLLDYQSAAKGGIRKESFSVKLSQLVRKNKLKLSSWIEVQPAMEIFFSGDAHNGLNNSQKEELKLFFEQDKTVKIETDS
jgi:predicted AlkP superfamily phosphohydrolase/phosphomutase/tetratricopeptide (TPR) repeat protein